MASPIELTMDGAVATLWLNRPEARNAFNSAIWEEFPDAVAGLDADPAVRVIVVAARGEAFTVGLDLKEYGPALAGGWSGGAANVSGRMETLRQIKHMQRTPSALADSPKPVIAAIHGYCLGAGVDLITACDIRLATSDAVFSVRESRMGLVADLGTIQRLPRIVPRGHANELIFSGRDFTGDEAASIGLVNRLFDGVDDLHKEAAELATSIAANSPLVVQGAKAVMAATETAPVAAALDYVAVWNSAFLHSEDLAEAVAAFLEKRPPDFQGR